jgi:O-antigen/teichoic acid export membrane protein
VVIGFAGYWAMSPVRFRVRLDREMARWFLRFGGYLWVSGIATYVVLEFDDFLVGTIAGALALGFYNRGYRFATLPTDVIGHVVSRVAFPLYAKLQGDRERLSRAARLILRALAVTSLPASVLLVLVAPQFVEVLLGEAWRPMVPLLQLLVVYSTLRPLLDTTGELFVAVGSPRTPGLIQAAQAVLLAATCPFAVKFHGAAGAAVAVGAVMVVGIVLAYAKVRRWIDVRYREVFGAPALAALVAALATLFAARALDTGNPVLDLGSRCAVFIGAFLLVLAPLAGRSFLEDLRTLQRHWTGGAP